MGEGGVQSNGRACRLRAPFKAHPAYGDSHAILSMRPTADPFSDGDTPSLPFNPHGRARMLRAPFKSRPSRGDSDAIPSTRRTADLISDGDTPSLPRVEAGGVAERAWGLSDARPAGTESGRGLPHSTTLRDLCERRRAAHRFLIGRIDAIVRGSFAP